MNSGDSVGTWSIVGWWEKTAYAGRYFRFSDNLNSREVWGRITPALANPLGFGRVGILIPQLFSR